MVDISVQKIVANHVNRQHGAMEFSDLPKGLDLDEVRLYRLQRVRDALKERDYGACILYDQINTRYATDVTDMQLWCTHNECRYVVVPAEGPVVVFEYGGYKHLSENVPTVDEVRPATSFYYMGAGNRYQEIAKKWAKEVADLINQHNGGNMRVAIDRMAYEGIAELQGHGFQIFDGFELMENAREIKSPDEITLMKHSIGVCERGMQNMKEAMEPGITENALWSKLHQTNIEFGGEWIETRLLSSGQRTNPWFRECSMRTIEKGDIVAFDTDLIGPYGYCSDISRAWICGDVKPSDEQRRLYANAHAQIQHNLGLMKDGVSFREITEKAWQIPDEFLPNRYGCILHGVGLADEYPAVVHQVDRDLGKGCDGMLKTGMTVCVESLIGTKGGKECIKLEEQILITENGYEMLSTYPMEDSFL